MKINVCISKLTKKGVLARKKDGHDVAKTHLKGTPHGKANSEVATTTYKKTRCMDTRYWWYYLLY